MTKGCSQRKHWLVHQNYVAPNTLSFGTLSEHKTVHIRSHDRKKKQRGFVLVDTRSARYCSDAEGNDPIGLGINR